MKTWGLAGRLLLALVAVAGTIWLGSKEHSAAGSSLPEAVLVSVQPPTRTVEVGERFTTTVEIASLATPLTAFQFDLAYDPALIRPVGVAVGDFLRAPGRNLVCPPVAYPDVGVIRYACANTGEGVGRTGDGALAELTFTALISGTSPLALSGLQLAGPGVPAVAIAAEAQGGEVTVIPVSTSAGIYLPLVMRGASTRGGTEPLASQPSVPPWWRHLPAGLPMAGIGLSTLVGAALPTVQFLVHAVISTWTAPLGVFPRLLGLDSSAASFSPPLCPPSPIPPLVHPPPLVPSSPFCGAAPIYL